MRPTGSLHRLLSTVLVLSMLLIVSVLCMSSAHATQISPLCAKYRSLLTREAQAVYGINAPIPMFAAQMEQESGCKSSVTAWDGGQGLVQFMKGTADQVAKMNPHLAPPDPYNPAWAFQAQVYFVHYISLRMKGKDACEIFGATLKGYNAGMGYPMQQQARSSDPTTWFNLTEYIPTKQSAKNAEYSREYSRWILLQRQAKYSSWGTMTCLPAYNPVDKNPVK